MLARSLLIAVTLLLSSVASAERRCTSAFKEVLLSGTASKTVTTASADACKAICIANAECAGYSYFTQQKSCVTVAAVASEQLQPGSALVAARCMKVEAIRLLLLPQEKVDYPGLDIANVAAYTAADCSYACQDTPGCNAYTWSSGSCYMKSAKPDVTKGPTDGSVVSGEVYTCQRPHNDADVMGEDLSSVKRPKWSDCCGVCRRTTGCVGFSWSNYNEGTCWLKKKITGFTDSNGVVAAIMN